MSHSQADLAVKDGHGVYRAANEHEILQAACGVLNSKLVGRHYLSSPSLVRQYLQAWVGHLEHEVFGVLYLTSQLQLLDAEILFRGTLTQTSVYPREVVKAALQRNAASLVLFHNHPSGIDAVSRADEQLTVQLKACLKLIDVTVLDHLIVTRASVLSMAENGLL
jgi:DNA repair protein RadC